MSDGGKEKQKRNEKTERGKRTTTTFDIQGGGVVVSGLALAQAQYPVSAAGATNGTDMGSVYCTLQYLINVLVGEFSSC